jgi:demethoxyubiquinone hydroxylase (CLK1/Coq7/Cat5 family)
MTTEYTHLQGLEVFTAVTKKNAVFWDVTPCGSCKNRVSEERSASIIRVTRIGELGTSAVTGDQRTLRRNTTFTLMMEALRSYETWVFTRFTQSNISEDSILQTSSKSEIFFETVRWNKRDDFGV